MFWQLGRGESQKGLKMDTIEINMLAYKRGDDGGLTALEMPGDPVECFGVYVMEYDGDDNEELEDHDFPTIEEASAKFAEMLVKYPGADENVYAMPRGGPDETDARLSMVQSCSSYNWTETAAEIAKLAVGADAIELAGCRDVGDFVERCDNEQADFFSVYFHFSPEWENDPNQMRGAMIIADRDTLAEARAFADEQAARWSLPVNDFAIAKASGQAVQS